MERIVRCRDCGEIIEEGDESPNSEFCNWCYDYDHTIDDPED